jgi:hypothetical protein
MCGVNGCLGLNQQCFGTSLDPDSIRSMYPDPDSIRSMHSDSDSDPGGQK